MLKKNWQQSVQRNGSNVSRIENLKKKKTLKINFGQLESAHQVLFVYSFYYSFFKFTFTIEIESKYEIIFGNLDLC